MNGSWTLETSREGEGGLSGTAPDDPCTRSVSPKDMVAKYTRGDASSGGARGVREERPIGERVWVDGSTVGLPRLSPHHPSVAAGPGRRDRLGSS
jgi:hypothetical protein